MASRTGVDHAPIVHSGASGPGAQRIEWVDMARGLCVIAVVLVHVVLFVVEPLSEDPTGRPLLKAWLVGNTDILANVRMPLLLFVSGWLASTKIAQGLGSPRTRLSVLTNLHIFLVWSLIYAVIDAVLVPGPTEITADTDTLGRFLIDLLYPGFGPLWFVYVLAVSVFALSLMRRLPMWLVLTLVLAIGWGVERLTLDQAGLPRAIYFALGVYAGPRLARAKVSRAALAACLLAAAAFAIPALLLPSPWQYPVGVLACAPLAVVFMSATRYASRWRRLRVVTAWVGRRTLGVYVLHWLFVGLLVLAGLRQARLFAFLGHDQVSPILFSLAATAVIVALCLVLEPALKRLGLGVLFAPPRFARRVIGAEHVRPSLARR